MSAKVIKVNRQKLREVLENTLGSTPITFVARTVVRMRKTGNPYMGATKVARVNGFINWSYERSVNRQRGREGVEEEFKALVRKWGERQRDNKNRLLPFVLHKDKTYVEVKVQKSLGYEYEFEGKPVAKDEINKFLPKRKEGARQEVERAVVLRDYALDSIQSVTVDGNTYEVE